MYAILRILQISKKMIPAKFEPIPPRDENERSQKIRARSFFEVEIRFQKMIKKSKIWRA